MPKKLFVGGLAYAVTDQELNELFAQAGTVASASVVNDRMTGRSRGFAFVEMSSDEEANKAIEMFNGQELKGRAITVNEARPPKAGGGFRPRGGGGGGRGNNW